MLAHLTGNALFRTPCRPSDHLSDTDRTHRNFLFLAFLFLDAGFAMDRYQPHARIAMTTLMALAISLAITAALAPLSQGVRFVLWRRGCRTPPARPCCLHGRAFSAAWDSPGPVELPRLGTLQIKNCLTHK